MIKFKNSLLVCGMLVLALYLFYFNGRLVYSIVEIFPTSINLNATSINRLFGSKNYSNANNTNNNSDNFNNLQRHFNSNCGNSATNNNNSYNNDHNKTVLNKTVHQKQANDVLKKPKKSNPRVQVKEQADASFKQNCSLWKIPSRLEITEDPLIKLNPRSYLYPGLDGGPNNQIKGFYQAMYLAVRLNRTLVVPVFFAHRTHPGNLSPYQFIDVERVCRFVSCMAIEDLRMKCNNSFDVALEARATRYPTILSFEGATRMKIMDPDDRALDLSGASTLHVTETSKVPRLPALPGLNSSLKLGEKMPSNGARLRAIYNTTAPCAIVTSLFNQILVKLNKLAPYPLERSLAANINQVDDNVLYAGIVDVVRLPSCIVAAAFAYTKDVLQGRDFIAIHWRYNQEDWMKFCVRPFPDWCKDICEIVDQIKPAHVANGLVNKMKSIFNVTQTIPVYIATPPSIHKFRNEIYDELQRISELFIRPSQILSEFLSEKYTSCWEETGWKIVEEIESFCEMEIMVRSAWFFFSPASTWSENIRPLRIDLKQGQRKRKFEANILKLARGEL